MTEGFGLRPGGVKILLAFRLQRTPAMTNDGFQAIDMNHLSEVSGGAARVAGGRWGLRGFGSSSYMWMTSMMQSMRDAVYAQNNSANTQALTLAAVLAATRNA